MDQACKKAASILDNDHTAILEAVEQAIMIMEKHPSTNAGHGSNRTMDGTVECDASIMDSSGSFGAIGAVSGIHHPIQVAKKLAVDSKTPSIHGLIRPMMLAGDAAREWAIKNNIKAEHNIELARELHKTKNTERRYQQYKSIIDNNNNDDDDADDNGDRMHKRQKTIDTCDDDDDLFLDTVGCVVINNQGHVAAGVSSGGIWLKTPGRVGEAAMYGAGCWAATDKQINNSSNTGGSSNNKDNNTNNNTNINTISVGVSVTGAGEYIMKNLVARDISSQIITSSCTNNNDNNNSDNTNFLNDICTDYLHSIQSNNTHNNNNNNNNTSQQWECGVLCVTAQHDTHDKQLYVDLCTAHIACASMAFGYYTPGSGCTSMISRNNDNDAVQCCTFGTSWKIIE